MVPVTTSAAAPAEVVLVGAHGHGSWHLENLRRLQAGGITRLVGVCDRRPPADEALAAFGPDVLVGADLGEVLASTRPAVTVICTPIHTHADLAGAAMEAGSHVLLEKPPAPTYEAYARIAEVARRTERACQIGFQDLGSTALPEIRRLVDAGTIGDVLGIGGACAWVRPTSYFTRAAWSGRRTVDGIPVVDGALTNPFAHAVASALALGGVTTRDDIADVEVELYRANDIEADDTSCLRVRTQTGPRIAIGASLCAATRQEPYLVVHGSRGRITLEYKTGLVSVDAGPTARWSRHFPRRDLLENLVAHLSGRESLLVPVEAVSGFMQVVEAVRTAREPVPIRGVRVSDPESHIVVPGIEEATTEVAERLATFSELDLDWAPGAGLPVTADLSVDDREVATYSDGSQLDPWLSPRPFLHPVRTLGGVLVSDALPADHRWHLGVGVAVQDVAGTNLWGGRTYVSGEGYRWRDDHGRTRHASWKHRDRSGFVEELDWCGPDERVLLQERRELVAGAAGPPDGDAWRLSWSSTLLNPSTTSLELGSPGSNGRAGGGYGGFFWRLPPTEGDLRVFTTHGQGEDQVHGSHAPWLATTGRAPDGRPWTLVFRAADPRSASDPWFVRVSGYPGIGSSLAWRDPLTVPPGQTVQVSFDVWVADRHLEDAQAVAAFLSRQAATEDDEHKE